MKSMKAPFNCDHNRNKNKSKFTCIPIGLTQGQFNLHAFKIIEQYKWFQMRSACLMAFCHLFIQDPLKWTSQTINTILINGAKVVKDNYIQVKENGPLDCVVNVENYIAKIRIEEPIFLNTVDWNTSLVDTLQTFFDGHQHGLFRCLNLCYLIWKTNGIYFLFDGQGNGSAAEDKNGFASLVCTESLKDVCKLLQLLSSIKSEDCYSLAVIKMKHFREGVTNYTKPRVHYAGTNTYTIVSNCFAILSGKFHVGHNGFHLFRNRQSMPVNLMALIYHTIQPANSWTSQLVDKIILLGTKLFHECKKTPQGEVTIQHLPRTYCILDYKFKIDYTPYDHSAQMSYSLDEMYRNLLMYLQRAFSGAAKNSSAFIQTNSLVFAAWESNDYYYIFDAYARNHLGEVTVDQMGTPCVQMHGSLESLCNVLANNLNAIDSNDGFVLHGVNVTLMSNGGKAIADADLELMNTFMDDLFWTEMNNFQESSARSEEICNLDDSSDDDIFMETVGGLKRAVSSIESSESRSTISFVSESAASDSRTDSSAQDLSSTQTNEDSDSHVSKAMKVGSKSPKTRKENVKETIEERNEEKDVEVEEQNENKRKKGKKSKQKSKDGDDDEHEEQADKRSKKKKKDKKGKNKGQGNGEETKQSLVVVESSSGTETSITKLLTTSFKISDRVLLVTEWGDFFAARDNQSYFLCDGCMCDHNALIQINLNELDISRKVDSIDDIVSKIMQLKNTENVAIQFESKDGKDVAEIGERKPALSGDVNDPMWELVEEMIELMKTTAKFDKIKNELV